MARGSDIGNPAGYMGDFARRGLGQNRALKEFREAGGSMKTEAFRAGYKSVRDAIASNPTVHSLPGGDPIGAEHYQPWEAGRPGRYAYQTQIHEYDPDIGGIVRREWTVTSDVPMTIDEATQRALDEWEEGQEAGSGKEGARATGATIKGLYRTV